MQNTFIKVVIFFIFCISLPQFAAAINCSPLIVKTHEKSIILPGGTQSRPTQVYFLQNISQKSLWIDHPSDRPGTPSAGWSSYFQPGKWSAILLTQKDFLINCAIIEPGKAIYQDCSKVISICVPEKMALHSKRKGSYWLAEDQTWDELVLILSKRGFFPTEKETDKKI